MVKLAEAKAEAVAASKQDVAKEVWCLETVLKIQDGYIEAFRLMKAQDFYKA